LLDTPACSVRAAEVEIKMRSERGAVTACDAIERQLGLKRFRSSFPT
jgi:hypothetical protein